MSLLPNELLKGRRQVAFKYSNLSLCISFSFLPLTFKNDKFILTYWTVLSPLKCHFWAENLTTETYSNLSIFYVIYMFFTALGSTLALHKSWFGFILHLFILGQFVTPYLLCTADLVRKLMEKMVEKRPLVSDHFHLEVEISDLVENWMGWREAKWFIGTQMHLTVSKQRSIRIDT